MTTLTDDDVPRMSPARRLLAGWRLAVAFMVIGTAGWFAGKNLTLQAQSVRVDMVETLCFAQQFRGGRHSLPEPPVGTEPTADCQAVKEFVEGKPRRRARSGTSWRLVRAAFASFHYLSPADGLVHQGRIRRDRNDQKQAIKVGDQITVYASRFYPESYTDLVSPTWP